MSVDDRADRVLGAIRQLIRDSGISQRKIEEKAGFSRGYLSQLLGRHVELKVRHLLAILDALDRHPADLFAQIYPTRRRSRALDAFAASSEPLTKDMDDVLGRLYGMGIQSLAELRGRLSKCEQAVAKLENLDNASRRFETGEG